MDILFILYYTFTIPLIISWYSFICVFILFIICNKSANKVKDINISNLDYWIQQSRMADIEINAWSSLFANLETLDWIPEIRDALFNVWKIGIWFSCIYNSVISIGLMIDWTNVRLCILRPTFKINTYSPQMW